MASKKTFAAIDFQGAATIKIGGTSGNSQYLKTASNGLLQWASGTSNLTKVSKYVAWNSTASSDAGVTFQNTSAGDETNTCTITHNLSTSNVIVSVIDNYGHVTENGNEFVDLNHDLVSVPHTTSAIRLYFSSSAPPTGGQSFNVTIIG